MALAGLIGMAVSYTIRIPWADEWSHVAILSRDRPVSLAWLWEQHNEHRFPLAKLFWIGGLRLTHFNFQLLIFPNLALFGALSAAMIVRAKALRGWTSYADAFFPLVILNPAQYENLFWGFQTAFVAAITLGCALLLMVSRFAEHSQPTRRIELFACATVVLLPLFTAVGLVFAAVLSWWFVYLGYRYRQNARRRNLFWAAAGLSLCLCGLYFIGWQRPGQVQAAASLGAAARTGIEYLSGSLGQATGKSAGLSLGLAVLLLIIATLVLLLIAWRQRPGLRTCTLGMLLFLGVNLALFLAVAWGRAGFGEGAGLASRYVTYMFPALCGAYFAWLIYAPPAAVRLLQFSLFSAFCIALPINVQEARTFLKDRVHQMARFETDLRAGMPPWMLVRKYRAFLDYSWSTEQEGAQPMRMLHRAGIGLFRQLKDTSVETLALPVDRHDGSALSFSLAKPELVSLLRLTYSDPAPADAGVHAQISWASGGPQNGSALFEIHADGGTYSESAPIDAALGELRIAFDPPPRALNITKLELLVSSGNRPAALSPDIEGFLDQATPGSIAGWAWDRTRPDTPIAVELRDGQTILATIPASGLRQDLLAAHKGNGAHAFSYSIGSDGTGGKLHVIRALVAGTEVELTGSPRLVK